MARSPETTSFTASGLCAASSISAATARGRERYDAGSELIAQINAGSAQRSAPSSFEAARQLFQ